MTHLLQIDGWSGSGKSLLATLLNGHSDLATDPVHDGTHMTFLESDLSSVLEWKNIDRLRKKIAQSSNYYFLERYALKKNIQLPFRAGTFINIPFEFDFYAFDKAWVQEVMNPDYGDWDAERLMNTIYKNYAHFFSGNIQLKYFVSYGYPRLNAQKKFGAVFPNSKSIMVKRDVEQIIGTRVGRSPKDDRPPGFFDKEFSKLINSNEVSDIICYQQYWDNMATMFPEKFKVVEFDRLVQDKSDTMQEIAQFLGIPFEPVLLKSTFMGREIIFDGMRYDEQVHDLPERLLTADQRRIIKAQIKQYNKCSISSNFLMRNTAKGIKMGARILHKIGYKLEHLIPSHW